MPAAQASKHSMTVPQLLLRWGMTRGVIPITRSSRVEGMKENLDSRKGEKLDQETMSSIARAGQDIALHVHSEKQRTKAMELTSPDKTDNRTDTRTNDETTSPENDEILRLRVALQNLALAHDETQINDLLLAVNTALTAPQVVRMRNIMAKTKSPFTGYVAKLLSPGDLGTCDIPKIANAALESMPD